MVTKSFLRLWDSRETKVRALIHKNGENCGELSNFLSNDSNNTLGRDLLDKVSESRTISPGLTCLS